MKRLECIFVFLAGLFLFSSCREDIVIDLEDGKPMIGVEASFTDEFKRHEVILSYTVDFYMSQEIQMISGAKVRIVGGGDTILFSESSPGHYLSDSVAGKKNTAYRLEMEIPTTDGSGYESLYADSYMCDNVESVDSVLMILNADPMMSAFMDGIYSFFPFFQSLEDPSICYLVHAFQNDSQLTNLTNTAPIPMAGYAGYYVNGLAMLSQNMPISVFGMLKDDLREGDRIRLDFYSIPADYVSFCYSVMFANGSNPMMGSPANVSTNIYPAGKAVGFFYAASVVSYTICYREGLQIQS